jgi:hypothetical protein
LSLLLALSFAAFACVGGCAYDVMLVVTTTARERCEWPERVALNTGGDRFRLPDGVEDARLRVDEALFPLAQGATLTVETVITDGRTQIRVTSGDTVVAEVPGGARISVQWTGTSERPLTTRQEFGIPEETGLPWQVDLEVRPAPQHRMRGECRLLDVRTEVVLAGPDAAALEFVPATLPRDGVVQGEVREREKP